MKNIEVEIKGPILLMHSPKSMLDEQPSTTKRTEKHDYDKDAEKSAYRTKKGELYIPSQALFSSILNGASFKKAGKYSAKSVMAGNIRIEPDEVILLDDKGKPMTKYEVDLRTVVIASGKKRNRIVRARPMVKNWRAKFNIIYNELYIGEQGIIEDCLKDAGVRVGLLEYRPQTSGNYGTFEIVTFKEKAIAVGKGKK
jgi:hypothetical protein